MNKRLLTILLIIIVTFTSCSGGDGGVLIPVEKDGIKKVKTGNDDTAAEFESNGLLFQVAGSWKEIERQTLNIIIENKSDSAKNVDFKMLKLVNKLNESLNVDTIAEVSNVNNANIESSSVELYKAGSESSKKSGVIGIEPKQRRFLYIRFRGYTLEETVPDVGQQIKIEMPTGESTSKEIWFNCEYGSIFDYVTRFFW
ncbi:MAG: hypothetical protein H7Z37_04350 [Pyrinomonadaceae bacterium]|nr:hypothetical protein [Pyrinomonadaceae bacterium]